MKIMSAVGAALLSAAIHTTEASATENVAKVQAASSSPFVAEYDDTLPPVGFVKFCATNSADCAGYNISEKLLDARMQMSPERWNLLYQVNTFTNSKIKPESDQDQYGEAERWAYPVSAGDCEDYALLKKKELEQLDFPAKSLRITVVLDEHSEGHAVLTVTTAEGDYVLDNRRNDILLWNDTNYTFLKRQSEKDPRRWVALVKTPAVTTASVASGQSQ